MTTPSTIYLPPLATDKIEQFKNIILGLQGPPGSGKTAAALTFPNPVVALFEKPDFAGLLSLPHLVGVKPLILPFYDNKFVVEQVKQPMSGKNADSAGAFKTWLESGDANKLTQEQTLVVDNWTRINEQFDEVNWSPPIYPTYNRKGEIDDFVPWDRKIEYAERISNMLISLSCNVVVLYHEIQERDKATGVLLEKIQPLQQGKFIAKLKSYFPNFYRQHCRVVKGADGNSEVREYVWQTRGGADFDSKCSKPSLPAFVPANYNSLIV